MKQFLRRLFGSLIGLSLLVFLLYQIDFKEILNYKNRIQYIYFIPYILITIIATVLSSLRTYYVFQSKISLKDMLMIHCISNAGEIFLKRAGDAIKIYSIKKKSEESYLSSFFKVYIEKFFDTFVVLIAGWLSVFFIKNSEIYISKIFVWLIGILLFFFILACCYIKPIYSYSVFFIKKIFIFCKKESFFQRKIKPYSDYIIKHISFTYCYPIVLTTIFIIFISNYIGIYYSGKILGIKLSYSETLFLSFCSNLAFLIPFVPLSGIGVYHTVMVTAFIIMGKTKIDGLAYAIFTHLISFPIMGLFGLIAYLYWVNHSFHKKTKGFKNVFINFF